MMMQLKKLFTPVSSMDAEEAKAFMAEHREGTTPFGRAPALGIRTGAPARRQTHTLRAVGGP